MKKTLFTGALAAVLIATGGTGFYLVTAEENPVKTGGLQEEGFGYEQMAEVMGNRNFDEMEKFMDEQNIDFDQMEEMMETGSFEDMQKFMDEQNINFGQMKPHMRDIHPDFSDQQLEDMYKGMHGTGGAENSRNFRGMSSNF